MSRTQILPRARVYAVRANAVGAVHHPVHVGTYTASGIWRWKRPPSPLYELYLIGGGTGTFTIDDRTYEATEGDFILVPPQAVAVIEKTSRKNLVQRFHHFTLGPHCDIHAWPCWSDAAHALRHLRRHHQAFFEENLFLTEHYPASPASWAVRGHNQLQRLEEERGPSFRLAMAIQMLHCLLHQSHHLLEALQAMPGPSTREEKRTSRHIGRALRYIETHLQDPISLHDVAQALSLSDDYLGRLFHQAMGRTMGNFIIHRKLEVAKARLMSGDCLVKEVAAALGFTDPRYFTRLFRRHEGMSPRAFVVMHGQ